MDPLSLAPPPNHQVSLKSYQAGFAQSCTQTHQPTSTGCENRTSSAEGTIEASSWICPTYWTRASTAGRHQPRCLQRNISRKIPRGTESNHCCPSAPPHLWAEERRRVTHFICWCRQRSVEASLSHGAGVQGGRHRYTAAGNSGQGLSWASSSNLRQVWSGAMWVCRSQMFPFRKHSKLLMSNKKGCRESQ